MNGKALSSLAHMAISLTRFSSTSLISFRHFAISQLLQSSRSQEVVHSENEKKKTFLWQSNALDQRKFIFYGFSSISETRVQIFLEIHEQTPRKSQFNHLK